MMNMMNGDKKAEIVGGDGKVFRDFGREDEFNTGKVEFIRGEEAFARLRAKRDARRKNLA